MSPSGASPVSSAMPKRSSASSRRAAPSPERCAGRLVAPGRTGPVAGRGDDEGATGLVMGRVPTGPVRGFCAAAASSAEISMVSPGPGPGSEPAEPGFFTWKTFLQLVQRTRTPRSVTFSSAIRNLD